LRNCLKIISLTLKLKIMRNSIKQCTHYTITAFWCHGFTSTIKQLSLFLLFSFIFSSYVTAQVPVIDGNPSEWPGILNNPANAKKAFAHDPFNQNGIDNQWTGGSQDGDVNPSTDWHWVYGNSNDKGDIGNAGAVLVGCTLYFMGDRSAQNGDAQIGFWFFIDDVQPIGTGLISSGFTGHHTAGDLLIISNFTNGGGNAVPTVYVWTIDAAHPAGYPRLISTSTNATLTTNATTYPAPNQLMFNGQTWSFSPKFGTAQTYPPPLFFEGSVNVCLAEGTPTAPCFQRFLLETRNSQSIGASLQDFVAGSFSGKANVVANVTLKTGIEKTNEVTVDCPEIFRIDLLKTTTAGLTATGADSYSWTQSPTDAATSFTFDPITGAATFTVNSLVNLAASYQFIVTGTNGGCIGKDTVCIRPVSSCITCGISGPTAICLGSPATYTLNDALNADFNYTWTKPDGSKVTNVQSITVTPTAAGNSTVSVTIVSKNGIQTCPGCSFSTNVISTPSVDQPGNQVICNGTSTTAITFTGVGSTSFTWTNNNTSIGLVASGTGNIAAFTATNTGVSPSTATIVVTPHFTGGGITCDGPAKSFTITVNPTPSVNQPGNQVICNGTSTTAITFTGAGSTSFTWTNDNATIGLAASGTGSINAFTGTNTGTSASTATIVVTPHFTGGGITCEGPSKSFTITVNPTPSVNQPGNQVICNGASTTAITFSGAGSTSFTWTNNNTSIGLAASGTGSINAFTGTNTGVSSATATIVVTPHFTGGGITCEGPSKSFTIIVNPTPSVNQPGNQLICNGTSTTAITFTGAGSTSFTWTNNNTSIGLAASGTGSINAFTGTNTGVLPSTATIVVTPHFTGDGITCEGPSKSFTITVNPTPSVNQPGNQVICNGINTTAITFTGAGVTSFTWTNNNTSIGLAASGTGNIAAFKGTTGASSSTATIVVTPHFTGGGITCDGPPKTFTITVNPNAAPPAVTYIPPTCAESTFKVQVNNPEVGSTYRLTQLDGNVVVIGPYASGTLIFTGLHIGESFSIISTTAAGCVSEPAICAEQAAAAKISRSSIQTIAQIAEQPTVIAAPNPFSDKIRFSLKSPVSGQGSLELYNMLGQRVKTVYQGHFEKGMVQTFEYNVPGAQRANLIYLFRIGNQKKSGKLIGLK
jgi:hypothetical protein